MGSTRDRKEGTPEKIALERKEAVAVRVLSGSVVLIKKRSEVARELSESRLTTTIKGRAE